METAPAAAYNENPLTKVEPDQPTFKSIREAAQALAMRRQELTQAKKEAEEPSAPVEAVEAPEEIPTEEVENVAPEEQLVSDEMPGEVEAEEDLPPIEPPAFWKVEERERFQSLPRETQEYLSARERQRNAEIDRIQREAAEKQKAFETEVQQVQAARQRYEQALAESLQSMMATSEFADITNADDEARLAAEDPLRYGQFLAHQRRMQAVAQQVQQAQQQQQQEFHKQWENYAQREDALFAQKFPDALDMQEPALKYLGDLGYSMEEITGNWNSPAWRDHRAQEILRDAVKYRKGLEKLKTATKKPVPKVQRPGTPQGQPNITSERYKLLRGKPNLTIREAAELSTLERRMFQKG